MISQFILVLFTLTVLVKQAFSIDKTKIVYGYFDDIKVDLPHDYLSYFKEYSANNHIRHLQTSSLPQPIRITFDFNNLTDTTQGITAFQSELIQKIVITSRSYLQKLIYVVPRTTPIKASSNDFCGDQKYPDYLLPTGLGISESDYHIIVRYYNNPNDSIVAKGGLCAVSPSPIIGQISFNLGDFVTRTPSHTTFQDYFQIALHEMIHSIGFGSTGFNYWINPDTEMPYNNIYDYVDRNGVSSVRKLITKNVVDYSKYHFNCQSIDGMYLENQGSSFSQGQHWERDLIPNEIMTASLGYGFVSISEFTASALRDSGFFAEINSNVIDPVFFGKNKGCDFFQNTCNSTITSYPEFMKKKSDDDYCDYEGVGVGYYPGMFSQCGLRINFNLCKSVDDIQSNSSIRQNTGEGSRCFESNAKDKLVNPYSPLTTRCFKVECNTDYSQMKVYIWGTEYVTCTQSLQVIDLSIATTTSIGTLTCPDNFSRYCTFPKFCKNFCNSNGYCQNGMCYCNSGWVGEECNIQCTANQVLNGGVCASSCSSGTFKNPNNTCQSTCPERYYKDSLTNECKICHAFCSKCTSYGYQTCQACNYGYSLQGSVCVPTTCAAPCSVCFGNKKYQCTSCNVGYYLEGTECKKCQLPCLACKNATQCLSCADLTNYSYVDSSNSCQMICHSSCTTCTKPNDPNSCNSCPKGYYLTNLTQCYKCDSPCSECQSSSTFCTNCIDQYYLDSSSRCILSQCHKSCKTCSSFNNAFACLSCYDGSYLSGNMCSSCTSPCKTCSSNSITCTSCITDYILSGTSCKLNCHPACISCTQANNNTACSLCNSGYYLTGTTCNPCQFPCGSCSGSATKCTNCKDTANYKYSLSTYTCNPICHASCTSCTAPNNSNQCTKCADGYYLSGTSCLPCIAPCLKCTSDIECVTCISGFNYDSIKKICYQPTCDATCKTCSTPNSSISCTSCVDGKYLSSGKCLNCTSPCLKCVNTATGCTDCIAGYYLKVIDCLACTSPCKTCSSSPTSCLSCITSDYTYDSVAKTCTLSSAINCDASCKTCSASSNPNACTACNDGYYLSNNQCQQCSSPCSKCSTNATTCSECISGYTLSGSSCSIQIICHSSCSTCSASNNANACTSCRSGYYLTSLNSCVLCSGACATCQTTSTTCLSCMTNYTYNSTNNSCSPVCFSACKTCTAPISNTSCLSCNDGYYLSNNSCLSCTSPCATCQTTSTTCLTCISNYNYVSASSSCSPICHTSCKTCSTPNSSSSCLSCNDGFYLSNNQCLSCTSPCATCSTSSSTCKSCVTNYTYNSTSDSCSPICYTGCLTCSAPNSNTSCLTCKDGYYLSSNQCLSCASPCATCQTLATTCLSCISNYNYNSTNQTCSPPTCHSSCKTCSAPSSSTSCLSCYDGYYLSNNQCIQCSSPCATCDTQGTKCVSCQPGYFYSSNNTCLPICHISCKTCTTPNSSTTCLTCSDGYYQSSNLCLQCTSPCANCSVSPTQCLSCIANYSFNSLTNTCSPICYSSCKTCSLPNSNTSCTSCNSGYYLSSSNQCIKCTSPCATCETSYSKCLSCVTNYNFNSTSNACTPICDSSCLTCTTPLSNTSCSSCNSGYLLQTNQCNKCLSPCATCQSSLDSCSSCISNYTYDSVNKTCSPICHQSCQTCSYPYSDTSCTSCPNGYYLSATNQCLQCQSPCSTCQTNSSQCLSCVANYSYNSTTNTCQIICYSTCKTCTTANNANTCTSCNDGYYLNGNTCLSCTSPCLTCTNSSTNCLSCISQYTFNNSLNSCAPICHTSCVNCSLPNDSTKCTSCPPGYFLNSSNQCLKCDSPCQECNTSSTKCTLCIANYTLDPSTNTCSQNIVQCDISCLSCSNQNDSTACIDCNPGYVKINSLCLRCQSPCSKCTTVQTNCTECEQNYSLVNSQCVASCNSSCLTCLNNSPAVDQCTSCNPGFYLSATGVGSCLQCSSNCLTCTNSTTCTKCKTGYNLLSGKCVINCHTSCLTCSVPNSDSSCLSCLSSKILVGGKCVPCPTGTYSSNNVCVSCIANCATCYVGTLCSKCNTGYILNASKKCDKIVCHYSCKECTGSDFTQCTSCPDTRELNPTDPSATTHTCTCKAGYTDINEALCQQSNLQSNLQSATTATASLSVTSASALSVASANPTILIGSVELSQSISYMGYINDKPAVGFDDIAGGLSYSHISNLVDFSYLAPSSNNTTTSQARILDDITDQQVYQENESNNNDALSNFQSNVNKKLGMYKKTSYFAIDALFLVIINLTIWAIAFIFSFVDVQDNSNLKAKIKMIFYMSLPIFVFYISCQEFALLIFQQLANLSFSSGLRSISSIMCLITVLYILGFILYLFYKLEYKKVLSHENFYMRNLSPQIRPKQSDQQTSHNSFHSRTHSQQIAHHSHHSLQQVDVNDHHHLHENEENHLYGGQFFSQENLTDDGMKFFIILSFFRQDSFGTRNFLQISLIRKIIISLITAYCSKSAAIQTGLLFAVYMTYLIFIIISKPFIQRRYNIFCIFIYSIISLVHFLYLIMISSKDDPEAQKQISVTMLVLIIMSFAIQALAATIFFISALVKKIKKKPQNQIYPVQQQSPSLPTEENKIVDQIQLQVQQMQKEEDEGKRISLQLPSETALVGVKSNNKYKKAQTHVY